MALIEFCIPTMANVWYLNMEEPIGTTLWLPQNDYTEQGLTCK